MEHIKVLQENGEKNGVFVAMAGGLEAGEMSYVWSGNHKFIIDHTSVYPGFRDAGVGKAMIMKAVEFARNNNLKIIPSCPFAAAIFRRYPEISDVKAV